MENVNDSFFDGHYKDIWRSVIPEQLTEKEVDFMVEHFQLRPGSRVLDLMCGYGRHTLALGRKDIEVFAIDNLGEYIDEIMETAKKEDLPVKAIKTGVLDFEVKEASFDLAICMGNSLNFFNASDSIKLLSNISRALRNGGHLLINTWSLAETVIKQFTEKSWTEIGDLKVLSDSRFLFHPTRVATNTHFITSDGKTETKQAIDYIFSVSEMESMLNQAMFRIYELYSIPGRKKFTLGEARAYILAEKFDA